MITTKLGELETHCQKIESMKLSRVWRGYGTAVFFEFGEIDTEGKGEYTLRIDHFWVIALNKLKIDSSNDELATIDKFLKSIPQPASVKSIKFGQNRVSLLVDTFHLDLQLIEDRNSHWVLFSRYFQGFCSNSSLS